MEDSIVGLEDERAAFPNEGLRLNVWLPYLGLAPNHSLVSHLGQTVPEAISGRAGTGGPRNLLGQTDGSERLWV